MEVDVSAAIGLLTFNATILAFGLWIASIKKGKGSLNEMIVANRSIGFILGTLSLIASSFGDTLLSGTADSMYNDGLTWCQIPIGYSISLLFGALLFAKPMRKAEYLTMLDPLQRHYGARIGGLLFVPALFSDIFRCAAQLNAIGESIQIIAGIQLPISISVIVLIAAIFTMLGGTRSVIWTDAVQLVSLAVSLLIMTPYAANHPAVSFESNLDQKEWMGEMKMDELGIWLDMMLLNIFGRIPWQGYFQRVLSIESASFARSFSISAIFGSLSLAVPTITIGIIAQATDWSMVEHYNNTMILSNGENIVPIVLEYLTPQWVSIVGLLSISTTVVMTTDSCVLGISSMFSKNIYKETLRPKATEREMDWTLRISVAIVSFLSATVALSVSRINYLARLCFDFVYIVLFPQLLAVIHWPMLVNSYGCIASCLVAAGIRISGGEQKMGIPALIKYPFYDSHTQMQKFPVRTTAMLSAIFTQLIVSFFTRNILRNTKNPNGVVQSSSGAALIDSTMNDASPGHLSDAPTFSSSRTDYDESSTDTQQQHRQPETSLSEQAKQQQEHIHKLIKNKRCDRTNLTCDSKPPICVNVHKSDQNLQGLQILRESACPKQTTMIINRPGQVLHHPPLINSSVGSGQILGVKNLSLLSAHMGDCLAPPPPRILSSTTTTSIGTPYAKVPTTIITNGRLESEKTGGDRSNMELNLNLNDATGIVKKNIKGVKLIGMEGGTLRRPSLQGTFSPTPSVEMVNIFDRRQSSGSFGPSSLSPIPGVEACKTHGTAINGQGGNEHCRIKRGIVRHHSFNDTGDRALTTLARQPNYPSMPLRPDDCRLQRKDSTQPRKSCSQMNRYTSTMEEKSLMETDCRITTLRRDKSCKSSHHGARYSACVDEKGSLVGHLLVSPTYSMYNSAVKSCNYFVGDDEAVSRF